MGRSRILVGRDGELAALDEALAELEESRGGLILIAGDAGIGKSRLLEETAARAEARGARVAWGRAWEVGGAPSYWPWIEALRALGLGDVIERGRDGGDRFALADAVGAALARCASDARLVLLFDDLHAADPSSLQLLELIVRGPAGARLLIVAAHREHELRRLPELAATLARLARRARVLTPRPLDAAAIGKLVSERIGRDDEEATRMVHEASEGNPLFVRELLELAATRGAAGRPGVPEGVRAILRERLAGLPAATIALLTAAAIAGREIAQPVAAEIAGVTTEALDEALDEARTAGLIEELAPGRLRFSHVLVAEALIAELAPSRRAKLHRRAAEVLERRHEGDPTPPWDQIAHHHLAAGPDAAADAVRAATRAAEQAVARAAYEDAVARYADALGALAIAAPADAPTRGALLLGQAEAHAFTGAAAACAAVCREVAAIARTTGDAPLLARAALTLGSEIGAGIVLGELVELLGEALAMLPATDDGLRARVMARLAAAEQPAEDPSRPIARAHEAIAMARRLGDPTTLLHVQHAAMGALMEFAHASERIPINEDVARLAVAAGDRPRALRAQLRLAFDRIELGDLPGFARARDAVARLAGELARPRHEIRVVLLDQMCAEWEGRFGDADALDARAHALAAIAGDDDLVRALTIRVPLLAGARGDVAGVARGLAPLLGVFPANTAERFGIDLWARLRQGDLAGVRRTRAALPALRPSVMRDPVIAALLAEVADHLDDQEIARAVYDGTFDHAGRVHVLTGMGFVVIDLGEHVRLRAASVLGLHAEARARGAAARTRAHLLGMRPIAAEIERTIARAAARAAASPVTARAPRPSSSSPPSSPPLLTLEGDVYLVTHGSESCRLRASRGLAMLARLLAAPGQEIAALDLVDDGASSGAGDASTDLGDAGEVLDAEARAAYKARLADLREELAEAESFNDRARAARLRAEADALTRELAAAVGLGGRARRTGGAGERARVNAQRRLADALRKIEEHCPALGRHLAQTIRTGTFCAYLPDEPRARR